MSDPEQYTQRLKASRTTWTKGTPWLHSFRLARMSGRTKRPRPALPLRAAFPRAPASMETDLTRKSFRASRFNAAATGWKRGRCRFLNPGNGQMWNATDRIAASNREFLFFVFLPVVSRVTVPMLSENFSYLIIESRRRISVARLRFEIWFFVKFDQVSFAVKVFEIVLQVIQIYEFLFRQNSLSFSSSFTKENKIDE